MAEEQIDICLLWGDWQIHQWWSCMKHSDWAAWVQALVVFVTLLIMSWQIYREKKKTKDEINNRKKADAISIKYYLREHRELVMNLDSFMSSYEMQYKHYLEIKKQSKVGEVVEEAIGCFMQPATFYKNIVDNLSNLDFDKRSDLHLNFYADFLDDIISGSKGLEYLFGKYNNKEAELNKLADGIFYFDEQQKEDYFNSLEKYHSEWITYADASHIYFMKIVNGWKGINSAVTEYSKRLS